jgi:hypothetical protein
MVLASAKDYFRAGSMVAQQPKLMFMRPHTLPLHAIQRLALEKVRLRPRRIGISFDPSDRTALEHLAEQSFDVHEKEEPLGTVSRGRLILEIMEQGFPTPKLAAEYFRNLEYLLRARKKREGRGQVVLGLHAGRSGSTSLTAHLATVKDSCSTHENPPLIFWTPQEEQVQFHMKRLTILADYFSLVCDVSHWWLNVLDSFFTYFPAGKIIGLIRATDECARSIMRTRDYGWGSWNSWVPYGNGIWIANFWDPTYPTYSVPSYAWINPDRAKYELIARYVREYNARLAALAEQSPARIVLVRTEELSEPATQRRIFGFVNVTGRVSAIKLNVRSVIDGKHATMRF